MIDVERDPMHESTRETLRWFRDEANCALCRGAVNGRGFLGIFRPDEAFLKRTGQPPDRQFAYAICDGCNIEGRDEAEVMKQVEQGILRDLQVQ